MYDVTKLARYPKEPGVYLMKGEQGSVLYVGKAKNLQARLKQYFLPGRDGREMIPFLISQIVDIETIVTFSEKEALILENNLIKLHKPKYNVLLKDDKTYISLMINHRHKWPMIRLVRTSHQNKKEALYFGPYTSTYSARCTLELMQRLFPLRQCSDGELLRRTRPCLLYGIKRCIAPCVKKCTEEEYAGQVARAIDFLKGKSQEVLNSLVQEMEMASENLEFEQAADLLKTIKQVEHITQSHTTTVQSRLSNCDAIGIFKELDYLLIIQMTLREGKLIGQESFNFSKVIGSESDILQSFLLQHYQNQPQPPPEILLPFSIENLETLSELIKIKLTVPLRGEKKKLIDLAYKNAHLLFKKELSEQTLREKRLYDLEETFHLTRCPAHIECFDTSNISGSDPVACMVTFTDGQYDKKRLRLFKVRGRPDDYSALREVLTRHYTKAKERDELPNLLIVDGGKGQLSVALGVLKELNIASVDLLAVTKEEGRHDKGLTKERVFMVDSPEPIALNPQSSLLFFLQQVRDEAHRVAINFQRKQRSKKLIKSELDEISSIGPKKRSKLLSHFGSVKRIKEASIEELLEVEGITRANAQAIRERFHKE